MKDSTTDTTPPESPAPSETGKTRKPATKRPPRKGLAPQRYIQRDFFYADLVDVSPKGDRHSMEHPFYSLKKQADTEIRQYQHNDVEITIKPSVIGMPTIWDKDIMIYATSQLVEGINSGRKDASNRTVRFIAYDYFVATERGTSGAEYEALEKGLERLEGVRIKTNIAGGGKRDRRGFGMIESWKIVEREHDDRMAAIEITLSTWAFNAIKELEVLSINRDYFRLTGGLERRLYELARKHCGNQPTWTVSEEILFKKSGSTGNIREFRRLLKAIIAADSIPDYRMRYHEQKRQIQFYTKDMKALTTEALGSLFAGTAAQK
ncbi:TPA: replication initiator protein A [Burkholderia cepacia]